MKEIRTKTNALREKVTALKNEHPLLLAMILLIFSFLMTRLLHVIYDIFGILQGESNIEMLIKEVLYLGVVLFAVWAADQKGILRNKIRGFFGSFRTGAVLVVLIAVTIIMNEAGARSEKYEMRSGIQIGAFIAFTLAVGLAEEILYRGIILETIDRRFGSKKLGAVFTLISSSVIFGLAHFSNIFAGQTVEETVIQVIAVTFVGMMFGVIYMKRRNIFAVAVIHGVYDLAVMYTQGIYKIGSVLDNTAADTSFASQMKDVMYSAGFYTVLVAILFIPYLVKLGKKNKETIAPVLVTA